MIRYNKLALVLFSIGLGFDSKEWNFMTVDADVEGKKKKKQEENSKGDTQTSDKTKD